MSRAAGVLVDQPWRRPPQLDAILGDAARLGFAMSCEDRTGALLAVLAASKPGGRLLELGTGVGAGAAWLLDGMSPDATLTSVELDPAVQAVAVARLGDDARLNLVEQDAGQWLAGYTGPPFDLAYVDCRPGKFERFDELLHLLTPGALYLGDDLLPQPTWPHDHQQRVDAFLDRLVHEDRIRPVVMGWASGLVVGARV